VAKVYEISNAIADAAPQLFRYPWPYTKRRSRGDQIGVLDGLKMYALLHFLARRAYGDKGPIAPNQSKVPGMDRTTVALYLHSACEVGMIRLMHPTSDDYPKERRYFDVLKYNKPVYEMALARIDYFVQVKSQDPCALTYDEAYPQGNESQGETFKVEDVDDTDGLRTGETYNGFLVMDTSKL
jgi:hypothetical protein